MKNLMEYKGYYAEIEYNSSDDIFHGKIKGINDLISFEGTSIEELKKDFRESVDEYLHICKQQNKSPDKTYKGSFNVRINPNLHKKAAIMATVQNISLNQFVEKAIIEKVSDWKN